MLRRRMLRDVVQGFLGQAIEIRFRLWRQPASLWPQRAEFRGDTEPLGPAADQLGESRGKSQVIQSRWPEIPGQEIDVPVQFLGDSTHPRSLSREGHRIGCA